MSADPSTFSFDSRDDERRHFWYLPHTARPDGATTQWLSFRFRSEGMCRNSPASHFAIVLRARLGFGPDGLPQTISGRGLTLGDTSLATPAPGNRLAHDPDYGGARGAQVESFWPGGNFLYRETSLQPSGLRDDCWYQVDLHVSDERWIAVRLQPDADVPGTTPNDCCVQDREVHPVESDASGALIALGRGPQEHGAWRATFQDIACGWF